MIPGLNMVKDDYLHQLNHSNFFLPKKRHLHSISNQQQVDHKLGPVLKSVKSRKRIRERRREKKDLKKKTSFCGVIKELEKY